MKYTTSKEKILGKWKYQAKYAFTYKTKFKYVKGKGKIKYEQWNVQEEADYIASIDLFLLYRSTGNWIRYGNNIYVMNLTDIFNLRMYHENGLKLIVECVNPL